MSSHVIKCHMSHVLPRLLQALTRYNTRIWIFLKVSMGISVIKKLFLILFVLCWDNNDFQFIYIETPLLTEFNYKLIWCLDNTLLCHLPIPPPSVASYYYGKMGICQWCMAKLTPAKFSSHQFAVGIWNNLHFYKNGKYLPRIFVKFTSYNWHLKL